LQLGGGRVAGSAVSAPEPDSLSYAKAMHYLGAAFRRHLGCIAPDFLDSFFIESRII